MRRATASMALGLVVLVPLVITGWVAHDYDAAVAETRRSAGIRRTLDEITQVLVDAQNAERGYALTRDAAFLAPPHETGGRLQASLRSLRRAFATRNRHGAVDRLERVVAANTELHQRVVDLVARGQSDRARAVVASGEGVRRLERSRTVIERLEQENERYAAALLRRAELARGRVVFGLVSVVLIALGFGLYATRALGRDVGLLAQWAQALENNERRFRLLAEGSSDLLTVAAADGTPEYVSPSSMLMLGYSPEELMQAGLTFFLDEGGREAAMSALAQALETAQAPRPYIHRARCKDGTHRWFETRIVPTQDAFGRIERIHSVSRDITGSVLVETEWARAAEELATIASHDELTGLLNRRGLMEHGARLLEDARVAGEAALLVFCDLDGLKAINDELGHEAGDEVLRDAASLLGSTVRQSDVVARLGGDEFVVLALMPRDRADAFARRLRESIRAFNAVGRRPYRVSMSLGLVTRTPDDPRPLEALLVEADEAMYRNKRGRRGGTTHSGEFIVRTGAMPQ